MKIFRGVSFISQEVLREIGINYPIKIEYYKTKEKNRDNREEFGIEVIKTEYKENDISIEKVTVDKIINDERKVDYIIDKLKNGQVTPVVAKDIIDDFLTIV